MLGRIKRCLRKEDLGQSALEVIGGALAYLAVLSLVLTAIGYGAKVLLDAINVTDTASLPVVGTTFSPISNAMSTGATIMVLFFVLMIIGGFVGVLGDLKREMAAFRQA